MRNTCQKKNKWPRLEVFYQLQDLLTPCLLDLLQADLRNRLIRHHQRVYSQSIRLSWRCLSTIWTSQQLGIHPLIKAQRRNSYGSKKGRIRRGKLERKISGATLGPQLQITIKISSRITYQLTPRHHLCFTNSEMKAKTLSSTVPLSSEQDLNFPSSFIKIIIANFKLEKWNVLSKL